MMGNLFDIAASLLSLTAVLAFVNSRFVRLPNPIGLLLMGLCGSLLIVGFDLLFPGLGLTYDLRAALARIDLTNAMMHGVVAYLLFAGCLQVDISLLRSRALSVAAMATVSLVISTAVIGYGFHWLTQMLGSPAPLSWSLVLGALLSPTDPLALQGVLKTPHLDDGLRIDMAGEALFNDGVGVVAFIALVTVAEGGKVSGETVVEMFAAKAVGGAALGLVLGWLACKAIHAINDYAVEILISIALVMGAYSLAGKLNVSGAMTVVAAGLLVGDRGARGGLGETSRRYLFGFWGLVDEMINAVLFLGIGMEVMVVRFAPNLVAPAAGAIVLALVARFVSVAIPVGAMRRWHPFPRGSMAILTWGGVRGGLSIAMAMSLPEFKGKALILSATYAVVVFSIVFQGMSLGALIRSVADGASARGRKGAEAG